MPKLIETLNPEVAASLKTHPFQDQSADIIAQAGLPRMVTDPAKEPLRPSVGRTGHVLAAMPTKFEALVAGPKDRVMPAFIIGPERARTSDRASTSNRASVGAHVSDSPMLPQKDMESHAIPAIRTDGYVRLRVRVTGDRMRILSVQNVEGPLAAPQALVGRHAYEVTLDARRIAAEGIPDVGVQRSFPRPGQHEHHVTELESFEFNVRVARQALPEGALDRLRINLYRFPDATPKPIAGDARLSQHLGPQAQTVAQIDGIQAQHVDPTAVEQFKKLFPSLKLK